MRRKTSQRLLVCFLRAVLLPSRKKEKKKTLKKPLTDLPAEECASDAQVSDTCRNAETKEAQGYRAVTVGPTDRPSDRPTVRRAPRAVAFPDPPRDADEPETTAWTVTDDEQVALRRENQVGIPFLFY